MVRPAEEVQSDLVVRAVSLPALEAFAIAQGVIRVVNLESFGTVPVPEDGLLLAIHGNDGTLADADAERVVKILEEAGVERVLAEDAKGLLAAGLVVGYRYVGEHGPGTSEHGAYAPWLVELRDVEPFTRPVLSPGWPGIYQLPDALERQIARAWVGRGRP